MRRTIPWGGLLLALIIVLIFAYAATQVSRKPNTEPAVSNQLPKNEYDRDLFWEENGYIHYENSLVGIDVSSHQEEIDWKKVKADGVDFAIIRAAYRGYTNGGLSMDPWFRENLQGAKKAGLQVGVYLFSQATTMQEAEEEAAFLLECLDGQALDFPVYYDWETVEADARTDHVTGEEVTAFALQFCKTVEAAGYKAGVYFNESMGYTFLRLAQLQQYEFWLAQYQKNPDFYYDFTTWQYTADGKVSGISTPVDLNVRFVK